MGFFHYRLLKSSADYITSFLLILLLLPLLLSIAVLVRLKLGSPILFKQLRPGLGGRPFTIFKFRTMTDLRDDNGDLLPDLNRLTPFGCFLRSTSIDELPELINILRGDMSFIGPRPLLMQYLPLYSSDQSRRHLVKPGLSGLAQINGRNSLSWEQKLSFDVWYVDHQSLILDLRILIYSIWKVVSRESINASDHPTMPPFRG